MVIDKTIFLTNAPSTRDVIWAKPVGDNIILHMYNRSKWVPVSGGGSDSSSDDTSGEKMIFNPNDFSLEDVYAILDAFLKKMNITIEDIPNMTNEEMDNFQQLFSDFVPTMLTTQDHGDIVLVGGDFQFLVCEDGTIFIQDENGSSHSSYSEMPSYMRYQVTMGLSSDTLVVRDVVTNKTVPNSKLHIVTDKVYVPKMRTGSNRDLIFHIDSAIFPGQESNNNSVWFAIDIDVQYFQDNPIVTPKCYIMSANYGPDAVENIYINKVVLQLGEELLMPTQ